jgi:hypothetical protein
MGYFEEKGAICQMGDGAMFCFLLEERSEAKNWKNEEIWGFARKLFVFT